MLTGVDICQDFTIPAASTIHSFVWQVIFYIWPWKWILIMLLILMWAAWEIATRNSKVHYNSKNGFSPSFNRFVGSGAYLSFQTILFVSFEKLFSIKFYCLRWPYIMHLFVFITTGLFLYIVGFWP
ncbi:hypothetical protein C0583_01505 [Candidatus Parcubacteria bacterium]|nr:MAG: hypothetical protein C0583_01505 [Candidatus Parcubacteria bacterium]